MYNGEMEIKELIAREEKRQQETLALIPSENYASKEVREAVGSVLANKYAEGYPGKRYYQGNGIIDEIENLAIERVKKLFGVPHANVQPYSGSPGNEAVLLALVAPGEKIMGLKLSGGGHLTHGHNISFSGKFFNAVQYDVDPNGLIDYQAVMEMAAVEKPKLIVAGTTAYPRIMDWNKFEMAAEKAGAYLLADISHIAGLVVGGQHPSPVPFADVIMTTTHKTLRGPRGAILMVTEKGLKKDPDLAKKIDRGVFPGLQGGPHENVVAGIAVALEEAATPKFREYARQIVANAKALSLELINLGFKLTTDGTDNHLMVIDLTHRNITGKEAAIALEEAGIIVNASAIPHDPAPPMKPSGIRLGTPAVTTRGMKEKEMKMIAGFIDKVISNVKGKMYNVKVEGVKKEVGELCEKFPLV
jgi:glycine hydroxymethyltransferase